MVYIFLRNICRKITFFQRIKQAFCAISLRNYLPSLMPLGDFARQRPPCSGGSPSGQFATVVRVWGIKGVGDKKAETVENQRPPFCCVQDETLIKYDQEGKATIGWKNRLR
jgi:hypothetical protein